MQFKFQIGTKVFFGKGCIGENSGELQKFGKRAVVVTGRNSGSLSGALGDIKDALCRQGIEYALYDRIENNPSLENVGEAGQFAASFQADFIIGAGGGSPLDAAKAVAVLAVNPISPVDLYRNTFAVKPLPVVAVPTTAGTGSEVTPYCILTRRDMETKMSFGNEDTFPKLAFMDPSYTESMPYSVTVNTAVDAMTHAVEGYLSRRSTPLSDILAEKAISLFGECLPGLMENRIDFPLREKLLYMAMLGGMVISHTGTTIVHGMGYSLTYFLNIPHGRANGLLFAGYLKYNYEEAREKIDRVLELMGIADFAKLNDIMDKLLSNDLHLDESQADKFASLAMKQKSTGYNIRKVEKEHLVDLFLQSCRK